MSFREISIAVRAENRASSVFRTISSDVLSLGMAFGALDSQTGRTVMQVFSVIRVFTSFKAILATATAAQTAHNVAVGAGAGVQTTFAISTSGAVTAQVAQNGATQAGIVYKTLHAAQLFVVSAAHAVYAGFCWAATVAANALNISTATFLALTGVGIAVIAAAAVAVWAFASSMNSAAASVQNFNNVSMDMPSRVHGIQRSSAEAWVEMHGIQRSSESSFYRRGIE